MPQKIESEKLLIKDVFSKWFRIPEYQRPYVWGKDQVTELLDDITQAERSNPDSQYFLGSLVLKKTQKKVGATTYDEFDLLDGQQRLTTLFLLLSVIKNLTNDTDLKDTCDGFLLQKENKYKGIPERIRLVFDIRDQIKTFVETYIINDQISKIDEAFIASQSDLGVKNMCIAVVTIRDYFTDHNNISDFAAYLFKNTLVIYVCAEELEDAFRLFTIMNNRGVRLRNSDIIKAENLGAIQDPLERAKWAKSWEAIENYFEEDFDAFLSYIRTILVKSKAQYSLLKEFEDNIYNPKNTSPLLEKGIKTFRLIDNYKERYAELFDNYASNELSNYLQLMQKGFEADFWIAPLLRYYDKFRNNKLIDFVKKLDSKFAGDWIVGETPTKRIENTNKIIQVIDDAKTEFEVLGSPCFYINKAALQDVFNSKIYGKRAAKYILLKLDMLYCGHGSKISYPDIISIEHMLPRNPSLTSQWMKDFTDEEREEWTHKIGNLVLISQRKNSSQGNKDFVDKKANYFAKNIGQFAHSNSIMSSNHQWTIREVQNNQTKVVADLMTSF